MITYKVNWGQLDYHSDNHYKVTLVNGTRYALVFKTFRFGMFPQMPDTAVIGDYLYCRQVDWKLFAKTNFQKMQIDYL